MTQTSKPAAVILTCAAKHVQRIAAGAELEAHWDAHGYSKCACGRPARQAWINGRVNTAKVCDGRCTSAKRGDCECECGGENHGADHVAVVA